MLDIVLILDESTSMRDHSEYYIQGVNKLITSQKMMNPMATLTLIKFSTDVNTLCVDSQMYTLPTFTNVHYQPEGATSLYDAIGHGIDLKYIKSPIDPQNVIMIIMTDGEDNNSHKYTFETIAERITFLKGKGWEFMFIATNQNVTQIGTRMNIDTCLAYNSTPKSISQVADACSIAIGHAIHKWSGVPNKYTEQAIPTDVRDLMFDLENFTI
jgi:hypothetical protein